jgi:hypothetical protein
LLDQRIMHLWRRCAPDDLPADLQDGIQHVIVKILYSLLPQPLGVGVRLNRMRSASARASSNSAIRSSSACSCASAMIAAASSSLLLD